MVTLEAPGLPALLEKTPRQTNEPRAARGDRGEATREREAPRPVLAPQPHATWGWAAGPMAGCVQTLFDGQARTAWDLPAGQRHPCSTDHAWWPHTGSTDTHVVLLLAARLSEQKSPLSSSLKKASVTPVPENAAPMGPPRGKLCSARQGKEGGE